MSKFAVKHRMNRASARLYGWSAVTGYVLLAFIALRKVLFAPGVIGHRWDWSIPLPTSHLLHSLEYSFYLWKQGSLGYQSLSLTGPVKALTIILYSPFVWLGLDGGAVSKFILLFTLVVSASGARLFIKIILRDSQPSPDRVNLETASFLGGLLYGFSPFIFNEMIGGSFTQILSYSVIPWFGLNLRLIVTRCRPVYLLSLSLLISILFISTQSLIICSIIGFAYCGWQAIRLKSWHPLVRLLICYLGAFLFNLYWIIQFVSDFGYLKGISASKQYGGLLLDRLKVGPTFRQALTLSGYWDRHMFSYALIFKHLWALSIYSFWGVLLYCLLIKRRRRTEIIFWLPAFLVSAALATGGHSPLGPLVPLFIRMPFMGIFRSTQHLIPALIWAGAAVVGLGISSFLSTAESRNRRVLYTLISIVMITWWVHPFFITGNVGRTTLKDLGRDHFDIYQLAPGYYQAFKIFDNDSGIYRVLPLPMALSPRYQPTPYQDSGQGGDPHLIYSPYNMVVDSGFARPRSNAMVRRLSDIICEGQSTTGFINMCRMFNIRYLVLRRDVTPNFGVCRDTWGVEKVEKLCRAAGAKKVIESRWVTVYKLDPLAPRVYIPSNLVLLNQPLSESPELASHPQFGIGTVFLEAIGEGELNLGPEAATMEFADPRISIATESLGLLKLIRQNTVLPSRTPTDHLS